MRDRYVFAVKDRVNGGIEKGNSAGFHSSFANAVVTLGVCRCGLMHCVLAFFFNTTLLALTINVAAGLI